RRQTWRVTPTRAAAATRQSRQRDPDAWTILPWVENVAVSATAQPTEPRISPDRKAISQRFRHVASKPRTAPKPGFCRWNCLEVGHRSGLTGSTVRDPPPGRYPATAAMELLGDRAMNDAFPLDTP